MREKWMVRTKRADFYGIADRFDVDPVIARLIVNRGPTEDADIRRYLSGDEESLYPPALLTDAKKAAGLLLQAIEDETIIAIATDYDVDGIMSGYLLKTALERLNGRCRLYTPDRVQEGYGLNVRIVQQAITEGAGLLLTCDNGIAAFAAVSMAKEKGMTVIITDHHEVPFEEDTNGSIRYLYAEADAIVNPRRPDDTYPFDGLCGAGVAFKLVCLLYEMCGIAMEEAYTFLEYVAIATVADVMELTDENRLLVRLGLKRLRTTPNAGLAALMRVNHLDTSHLGAYHIGFVIGPCLNAAGRIDDVRTAFELLFERDQNKAQQRALKLKEINDSRKQMTQQGAQQAYAQIEALKRLDRVLVILLAGCHESLVGIIAGRLREKYHRPAIVFTPAGNGLIKGSGRSIESYNMFAELMRQKSLLLQCGGHPMAAGLTMEEKNLELLRQKLNAQTTLTEADLVPVVHIDMAMPVGYITDSLIEQIQMLEPFGKGNPKPVFAERFFHILRADIYGKDRKVLKMLVEDDAGSRMQAIYFGDIDEFAAFIEETYGPLQRQLVFLGKRNAVEFAMTYYPQIDEYMGRRQIQIVMTSYCRISRD